MGVSQGVVAQLECTSAVLSTGVSAAVLHIAVIASGELLGKSHCILGLPLWCSPSLLETEEGGLPSLT